MGVQGEVSFTTHSKPGSHFERTTLYDHCKAWPSFNRPPAMTPIRCMAAVDFSWLILFHYMYITPSNESRRMGLGDDSLH